MVKSTSKADLLLLSIGLRPPKSTGGTLLQFCIFLRFRILYVSLISLHLSYDDWQVAVAAVVFCYCVRASGAYMIAL